MSCRDDDMIHILDGAGALTAALDTGYGSAPNGLAISPDGNSVYVALEGSGELRRYDTASRVQTGSLQLGPTPRALAVSGDGSRVLVTRFLSPRNQGEIWDVDAATFSLTRTIRIPKFGGEENMDTTAAGHGVANYLAGITISPDGQSAWVASNKANTERGLFFVNDLDQDNTVRNIISRIDLTTNLFAEAIDLDNSDSATAVAYSPLGDYLLVTLQGTNDIVVLDPLLVGQVSGLGSLVARWSTGLAPQGICGDPATGRMFVKDFMDRSISALETADFFQTGNKTIARTAVSSVASESLSAQNLLGKQIFYNSGDPRMSAEGYISCATCHADGGHDGRVWDFTGRGEGFRNTTTLRGRGGAAHGNVHWTANFDEIQDFEHDIRGPFGGTGLMSDADFAATNTSLGPPKAGLSADLDALAAYVTSLDADSLPRSPYRNIDGSMTASAIAGETLFQSLSCANCHAGSSLTDSTVGAATLHNVGTLRTSSGQRLSGSLTGIDTPTLRGLWATAPYFHDGSAASLEQVFVVAGGAITQAENGVVASGAVLVNEYIVFNNDDTVHNDAYIAFEAMGARVTLSGVDGGTGGIGALELRYSVGYNPTPLEIRVNGALVATQVLGLSGNLPQWRHTYWDSIRIESVALNAGSSNTIELSTPEWSNFSLDDVLISTAAQLSLAQPHRQVLALTAVEQADLIAYLNQLDGSSVSTQEIFSDGFEQ